MKLSFKQVVEKVGANASTLAFQRDKFSEFIDCTGEGRLRRYSQQAVDVLSITSKMYAEGKTYDEIKDVLEGRYGVPTDIVLADNNATTTQQGDLIQSMRLMFAEELNKRDRLILDLQEELQGIKQTLIKQAERNEDRARRLEERDKDITQRLRDITTAQEQRNKEKIPWYRRLLNLDK